MTNKNILYKLFELKPNKYHLSNADMYEDFDILDIETNTNLDGLYWKFNNKLSKAGGATGLLNIEIEKGYLQVFYTERTTDDNGNIIITFMPAYTKNEEIILLKWDIECPFCSITTTSKIEDNKIKEYCFLTFLRIKYGKNVF